MGAESGVCVCVCRVVCVCLCGIKLCFSYLFGNALGMCLCSSCLPLLPANHSTGHTHTYTLREHRTFPLTAPGPSPATTSLKSCRLRPVGARLFWLCSQNAVNIFNSLPAPAANGNGNAAGRQGAERSAKREGDWSWGGTLLLSESISAFKLKL